jgi:hypothetical protein
MRFVKTRDDTLAPFDHAAIEWMHAVHTAEPVTLTPLDEDGSRFRGYVFACINELAQAMRTSPANLRAELLLETGRFTSMGQMFGTTIVAINSMSRSHMSDAELRQFWNEASDLIRYKMLCRVSNAAERDRLAARLMPPQTEEASA